MPLQAEKTERLGAIGGEPHAARPCGGAKVIETI